MWWSLQADTTVDDGDVTPSRRSGRSWWQRALNRCGLAYPARGRHDLAAVETVPLMPSEKPCRGAVETENGGRRVGEQARALRRVTALVLEEATPSELFAAVVDGVVEVLDAPAGWLFRYQADRSI